MKKLIITLLALAFTAAAQDAPKWQQKVFDVKHAQVPALADLVRSVCQGKDTRVIENPKLGAISVGTTTPSDMAAAEEIIKRYDVPRGVDIPKGNRNIELVAYMLMAAPKGTAGDALPAELDPVTKQLKAVFGYNDFRLLDSALLRAREGTQAGATGYAGSVNPTQPGRNSLYFLRFNKASIVPSERGNTIKLNGFRFSIRVPDVPYPSALQPASPNAAARPQFAELGFDTELDIREGQKVVVGKAKMNNADSAFILVLTAKALD